MRVNSPLTGAAVELVARSAHGTSNVVTVRLLEPAGNYSAGITLHVGAEEFIAESTD